MEEGGPVECDLKTFYLYVFKNKRVSKKCVKKKQDKVAELEKKLLTMSEEVDGKLEGMRSSVTHLQHKMDEVEQKVLTNIIIMPSLVLTDATFRKIDVAKKRPEAHFLFISIFLFFSFINIFQFQI